MKDRMFFTIILSLVVILPALEPTKTVNAVAGEISVPGDYATIQAAINHASSGYRIIVHNGTYVENVVVNKSVSLFGEDRDRTFIDGNQSNSVVNITANDVAVEGFTIKNSGTNVPDSGIYVEGSSRVIIRNNTFTDNSNAVSLRFCTDNAVLNNTMFSNDGYGVYLSSSANNVVSDNMISSNDLGVFLFSCSANTIEANVFFDNHYGIFLFQSVGDVISGNSIYSNDFGIYLLASTNNTIYHNNIDDIIQASSDSVNYWNYTGEGNHWRDYLDQDFNQDGIGDQPYVIDERNQDYWPLIGRFSDFRVTSDGKTHHVSTISNSLISDFEFRLGLETGNKIVRFNATGAENPPSFCRIGIPTELLSYPYILLVGDEEIAPTVLSSSNETYVHLYITNIRKNQTIIIISSKALSLYNGLLENFTRLLTNLQNLSTIYESLLSSYATVLGNCTQLQEDFASMNLTYYALQSSFAEMSTMYDELASNFSSLQTELDDLNTMYDSLLGNYSQLQESFNVLNASYQNLWGLNATHYELAGNYSKFQTQLSSLNATYNLLLSNYTLATDDYGKLQQRFDKLNASYQDLFGLNATYQDLMNSLQILSTSYGQLQDKYQAMNASYQTHLQHYSENVNNIQNLIYIFAAMTAILIVTTVYLSKRAHTNMMRTRKGAADDRE